MSLRKHLAQAGFDPLMGARPMQRLIHGWRQAHGRRTRRRKCCCRSRPWHEGLPQGGQKDRSEAPPGDAFARRPCGRPLTLAALRSSCHLAPGRLAWSSTAHLAPGLSPFRRAGSDRWNPLRALVCVQPQPVTSPRPLASNLTAPALAGRRGADKNDKLRPWMKDDCRAPAATAGRTRHRHRCSGHCPDCPGFGAGAPAPAGVTKELREELLLPGAGPHRWP